MNVSNILVMTFLVECTLFVPVLGCDVKVEVLRRATSFKIQTITGSPNVSIINGTVMADTLMKCAYDCANRRSKSLYYLENARTCHCNQAQDSNVGFGGGQEIVYGEMESLREESANAVYLWPPPPMDCLQLYQNGAREDRVYTIQPVGGATVNTWCDMTNGGWTVFQRRQDGSKDFFRNWTDYVKGFGDKAGENWLGLEHIHLLIKQPSELNITLVTFGDVTPISAYASYSTFTIGDCSTNYRLTVAGFGGDCGDSLVPQSGFMFSTYDRDNDGWESDCANTYKGAWWYAACHTSNLNGWYVNGSHTTFGVGINWYDCWGQYYSVKETVMKVRRL